MKLNDFVAALKKAIEVDKQSGFRKAESLRPYELFVQYFEQHAKQAVVDEFFKLEIKDGMIDPKEVDSIFKPDRCAACLELARNEEKAFDEACYWPLAKPGQTIELNQSQRKQLLIDLTRLIKTHQPTLAEAQQQTIAALLAYRMVRTEPNHLQALLTDNSKFNRQAKGLMHNIMIAHAIKAMPEQITHCDPETEAMRVIFGANNQIGATILGGGHFVQFHQELADSFKGFNRDDKADKVVNAVEQSHLNQLKPKL